MPFQIRPYHPSDLPQLYRICLQTAYNGEDGSRFFANPDLMGHFYIGPFATLEPDLCFVLLQNGRPAGYICATRNVHTFRQNCEQSWFPPLRTQYPLTDRSHAKSAAEQELYTLIHEGIDLNDDVAAYPARLHIALLPSAQRRGFGTQLIHTLIAQLRSLNVSALQLEVSSQNQRAIAFYEATGFHKVADYSAAYLYGYHL